MDLRVGGRRTGRPVRCVPGRRTRASTPSTARSPAAAGRRRSWSWPSGCRPATRPTCGRPSPASRVQGYAGRGQVRDVASVFDRERAAARGCSRRSCRSSCATASRTACRPARIAATCCGSTGRCSSKAGVTPPGAGYTLAGVPGRPAEGQGGRAIPAVPGRRRTRSPRVELFENMLLSTIGTEGWQDMVADGLDWRGTQVADGARPVRRDARLRRPGGERADVGPGDARSSRPAGARSRP